MPAEERGFFAKLKDALKDTALEAQVQAAFERDTPAFFVATAKGPLDTALLHGRLEGKVLTLYGRHDVPYGAIVLEDRDGSTPYAVLSCSHEAGDSLTVEVERDGKRTAYVRPATVLVLSDDVEEVAVVTIKGRHYRRKERD